MIDRTLIEIVDKAQQYARHPTMLPDGVAVGFADQQQTAWACAYLLGTVEDLLRRQLGDALAERFIEMLHRTRMGDVAQGVKRVA